MPTSVLLQILQSVVKFLAANHMKLRDVHCIEHVHVIMFIGLLACIWVVTMHVDVTFTYTRILFALRSIHILFSEHTYGITIT